MPGAVVLAAGKGTRMRSRRHKVLHEVAGRPMIWHILTALHQAGIEPSRTVVVIGDSAPQVREAVESAFGTGRYAFALQEPQLGTGHAALQARPHLPEDVSDVVVAFGDTPLLQAETVRQLLDRHHAGGRPVTLVTGLLDDPTGYGRIVRHSAAEPAAEDADGAASQRGAVLAIVEERDATPQERRIREINSGFSVFDAGWLWSHLPRVGVARNGEIYLTALAAMAVAEGDGVETLVLPQVLETLGVNSRRQLAEAEAIMRRRLVDALLDAGVTVQDPATTYVEAGVTVGQDSVILANTHLGGQTTIGADCVVGPNAIVRDSVVGDGCRITASVLNGAVLEEEVAVGPFAHLRPGTRCGRGSIVGTGSELNRSSLGAGSRVMHFGYLGDATVGVGVNVGAGTVTCNFDGERKHATRVGDGAFIGSGSLL
ncbi:MAG TPA: bifunctional UDP-N-acetylglucosamine diphosphorylase/glucosamine-1-phosphate N-acetyltransferase GlmU, partial [Chloroflexota bacterium]|nr:bifunctional UDP-N-acetylglucosamine diphosphorylase/glucosamine-1-phosphate N-acetyltransferase GlmU [Chloroflexota bacterium]